MSKPTISMILFSICLGLPGLLTGQDEVSTGMYFRNQTDSTMTIRCITSNVDKPGFNKEIREGVRDGAPNFLTGKRVIAIWVDGKAHAFVEEITTEYNYEFSISIENDKIKVIRAVASRQ